MLCSRWARTCVRNFSLRRSVRVIFSDACCLLPYHMSCEHSTSGEECVQNTKAFLEAACFGRFSPVGGARVRIHVMRFSTLWSGARSHYGNALAHPKHFGLGLNRNVKANPCVSQSVHELQNPFCLWILSAVMVLMVVLIYPPAGNSLLSLLLTCFSCAIKKCCCRGVPVPKVLRPYCTVGPWGSSA